MKRQIKEYLFLFLVAFIFNILWEFSHYPLYTDLSGIPKNFHLLQASFFDAIIIFSVFLLVSLINQNTKWIVSPDKKDYFIIILSNLIIAVLIESVNLNLKRWAYTSLMPTIFGVGISPIIQLFSISILTLVALRIFHTTEE